LSGFVTPIKSAFSDVKSVGERGMEEGREIKEGRNLLEGWG
jgi:hypothetical protein